MKVFKMLKKDPLLRSTLVLLFSFLTAKLYLVFVREPVIAMDGHLVLKFLVSVIPSFVFFTGDNIFSLGFCCRTCKINFFLERNDIYGV